MELQFRPDPARKLSANLYDIYHCCVYSEKFQPDVTKLILAFENFECSRRLFNLLNQYRNIYESHRKFVKSFPLLTNKCTYITFT